MVDGSQQRPEWNATVLVLGPVADLSPLAACGIASVIHLKDDGTIGHAG